ncbi:hypothetical protein TNCV_2860671 [Trichonephila clavipes]|nr:hypothetical protein TNCV_2860671 [Trichonephila clavipes]
MGEKRSEEKETTSSNNIPLFKMFKLVTVSCNAHLDPRLNITLAHVSFKILQCLWRGHVSPLGKVQWSQIKRMFRPNVDTNNLVPDEMPLPWRCLVSRCWPNKQYE